MTLLKCIVSWCTILGIKVRDLCWAELKENENRKGSLAQISYFYQAPNFWVSYFDTIKDVTHHRDIMRLSEGGEQ